MDQHLNLIETGLNDLKQKILSLNNIQDAYISDLFDELNFVVNQRLADKLNKNHKAISLIFHDGKMIEIDENIAPLIKELWTTGIKTLNSCENNVPANYIWIEFMTFDDLKQFLDVCFLHEDINKENIERGLLNLPYEENAWIYKYFPFSDEENIDFIEHCFSVRFPLKDYEFVLNKFINHNKQIKNQI
jgi:hypothetical protein